MTARRPVVHQSAASGADSRLCTAESELPLLDEHCHAVVTADADVPTRAHHEKCRRDV